MFSECSLYSVSVALSNWQFGRQYLTTCQSSDDDGPVPRTDGMSVVSQPAENGQDE